MIQEMFGEETSMLWPIQSSPLFSRGSNETKCEMSLFGKASMREAVPGNIRRAASLSEVIKSLGSSVLVWRRCWPGLRCLSCTSKVSPSPCLHH